MTKPNRVLVISNAGTIADVLVESDEMEVQRLDLNEITAGRGDFDAANLLEKAETWPDEWKFQYVEMLADCVRRIGGVVPEWVEADQRERMIKTLQELERT